MSGSADFSPPAKLLQSGRGGAERLMADGGGGNIALRPGDGFAAERLAR
jgi:hypothetical protein